LDNGEGAFHFLLEFGRIGQDVGAERLRLMVFIALTFTKQMFECKGKIFGFGLMDYQ
jgi:hypothetical protein